MRTCPVALFLIKKGCHQREHSHATVSSSQRSCIIGPLACGRKSCNHLCTCFHAATVQSLHGILCVDLLCLPHIIGFQGATLLLEGLDENIPGFGGGGTRICLVVLLEDLQLESEGQASSETTSVGGTGRIPRISKQGCATFRF